MSELGCDCCCLCLVAIRGVFYLLANIPAGISLFALSAAMRQKMFPLDNEIIRCRNMTEACFFQLTISFEFDCLLNMFDILLKKN